MSLFATGTHSVLYVVDTIFEESNVDFIGIPRHLVSINLPLRGCDDCWPFVDVLMIIPITKKIHINISVNSSFQDYL